MDQMTKSAAEDAAERLQDLSVGCAESFTGGALAQALAAVANSSDWFCGGVVAYRAATKRRVLGVGSEPVISEQCAARMAAGVMELMDADVAVSITGVGGPTPQEGNEPGTVIVGWSTRDGLPAEPGPPKPNSGAVTHFLTGEPDEIIRNAVITALTRLASIGQQGRA